MNAARRAHQRRDWPRGLKEPRPGYYAWVHPDGRTMAIGRVPLAVAKMEALAANQHVAGARPGLVDRLSGAANTMASLIAKMPAAENTNTSKTQRSIDKIITAKLGGVICSGLTVADCAKLVDDIAEAGKARSAESVRSRLIAICKRGQQLGWMDFDPASITARPKVTVQRGRLTLETFRAIYAVAGEAAEWLPRAMMLALVTGADRSTIAALQRDSVAGGYLTITRVKTGVKIAIPTSLRMDAVGVTLADELAQRTGVVSRYLVHHVNPWGNAPAGSAVHPDRISHAFTAARKLAGIPDEAAPTFHELRSLCKRLYEEQGGVDTKALLGHATERMSALYANPRGVEAIKVRVA